MCIMCALIRMQLLGCVATVVMIVEVTTALTEEDHTLPACRHPHSSRSQVGCKMAALRYFPRCGVPSPGSHSTRQGRKPRRLHAGPVEQVDLQPDRAGDPPSHLADGSGGSSPLW